MLDGLLTALPHPAAPRDRVAFGVHDQSRSHGAEGDLMTIKGRYVPGAAKVTFVDREDVLAAFDEELVTLGTSPRLLSLYGVGGIGKSRLLHELRRRTRHEREGVVTAALNLQEPEFRSAAGGLASLRADLGEAGVRFDRFDLAYALWWQRLHPMQPLSAAPHPWISGGETVAEIVGDVALGAPGLGAVVKLIDGASRRAHERQIRRANESLRELRELSVGELRDAVVHWFAQDLNAHHHVVFLDAYDALERESRDGAADGTEWVRDLCGQLDGLVVIASREPLGWMRYDDGWAERIRALRVPPLPHGARLELLGELGVGDPEASRALAEASHGLPYFLHLASESGDSRGAYTQVEERFLRHVDPTTARYLRLLSVARVFDRYVFDAVAERYRLPSDPETWDRLRRYSFIARAAADTLQMHQLMARAIREGLDRDTFNAQHALLRDIWRARAENSRDAVAWREAAFHAAAIGPDSPFHPFDGDHAGLPVRPSWTTERAETALLHYVDQIAAQGKSALDDLHADLVASGSHARLARLVAAESYLVVGDAHGALDVLGDVSRTVSEGTDEVAARLALAAANAYRINGDTTEAIRRLRRIWPFHQGPCRYDAGHWLADLTMAEGRFADAITIADDVERAAPPERAALRADLARLRCLTHHYALDVEGATVQLERSMEAFAVLGHRVGIANGLTNKAEILARTDPPAAVEAAWEAVRVQGEMGSDIEIGKALTALALAQVASGDVVGARDVVDRALATLERCGYRSGRARAELVSAFCAARAGERDDAVAAALRAVTELVETGVYPVLIVLADLLLDRIGRPRRSVGDAAQRARSRVQPLPGREGEIWHDARVYTARLLGDAWDTEYERALAAESRLSGYYNLNVRSGGSMIRIPIADADSMDLRIWNEADVLAVVQDRFDAAPRLVAVSRDPAYQVHEWVDGDVLNDVSPKGAPVPDGVAGLTGRLLARIAEVPLDALPALPDGWPADGDSAAFAGRLLTVTRAVHAEYRERHAALWAALGIPDDPFEVLDLGVLAERPSVLVHSDVHRKNVILRPGGGLTILDWELALVGDPVYELAVHLHKTDYTPQDDAEVRRAWTGAWDEQGGVPERWEVDLDRYLAHERVKSAVVDSVRYAKDLGAGRRAAGSQDPPSSGGTGSVADRAMDAAHNYAPKLARARSAWGDERPVDLREVAAALAAASG